MHPEVRELVKSVYAGPDTLIRRTKTASISINKYTQLHDHNAEQYFTEKDIRNFADTLPYDKSGLKGCLVTCVCRSTTKRSPHI